MAEIQIWLVHALDGAPGVARVMRSAWMWPIAESLHFIGLSLLALWLGGIVAGRLLTFYRPFDCAPGEASGRILLCVPGKAGVGA